MLQTSENSGFYLFYFFSTGVEGGIIDGGKVQNMDSTIVSIVQRFNYYSIVLEKGGFLSSQHKNICTFMILKISENLAKMQERYLFLEVSQSVDLWIF